VIKGSPTVLTTMLSEMYFRATLQNDAPMILEVLLAMIASINLSICRAGTEYQARNRK
jgi:hypothetical protein